MTPVAPLPEPAPAPTAPPLEPRPTAEQSPAGTAPGPQEALQQELDRANRAYGQAQFPLAADLYRGVLRLGEGTATPGSGLERVRAFAALRLGLSELLARNDELARELLQEQSRSEPDEAFRQMAFQLWDAYAMTGDPVAACARVSAFAQERGVSVESGAAGPIGPDQICVVPEAGATGSSLAP